MSTGTAARECTKCHHLVANFQKSWTEDCPEGGVHEFALKYFGNLDAYITDYPNVACEWCGAVIEGGDYVYSTDYSLMCGQCHLKETDRALDGKYE